MNQAISFPMLAKRDQVNYIPVVAVNPVTGFCSPINNRRTSVHVPKTDAFLCLSFRFMVAVRGALSSAPGSYCPGLQTCVQPPPNPVLQQSVAVPQQ